MFQLFAAALLAFFGGSAHAEPEVGDLAIYSERLTTKKGSISNFTNVVQLVRFDTVNHRFLERDTRQVSGHPDKVVETWKETVELFTDEKVESILRDCPGAGGESALVWVPAGIYDSCMMPVRADDVQPYSGKIWISRVPFGLARAELHGPKGDSVINLRSYDRPSP